MFMKPYLFIAVAVLLSASCALAQFPDITLPGGSGVLTPMPAGPGAPVDDVATNVNTDITATSVTTGGMAGGFDPNLALAPELQQQVSSAGGLPLDNAIPNQYPALWPGYTDASYGANYAPNSPEGDMLTTLGTLQGTLQAGADQQNSQIAELNRLEALESENAAATGIFQLVEIANETAIFEAQEEMKHAQLNALVVAESNRQNKEAQEQLESLGIATEKADWDATNEPPGPGPQLPYPLPLTDQTTE